MSSASEASALIPPVEAGEAPEGKNGGRAAAPNPTPKAPAPKKAPAARAAPSKRADRHESSNEQSRVTRAIQAAADAAEKAQLDEAEPSEHAQDAARDKGAAAKPPTEGAKGVPVSKRPTPHPVDAGGDPKGEKREKRDRSNSKKKPGISWPESLKRRAAREKAAAVERETEAAEHANLHSAQEAERQLRLVQRDSRKREQLALEGQESFIKKLANNFAADASADDAGLAAEAVDGGGGENDSSSSNQGGGEKPSPQDAPAPDKEQDADSAKEAMNNDSAAEDSDSDEEGRRPNAGGGGGGGADPSSTSSEDTNSDASEDTDSDDDEGPALPLPPSKPKRSRAASEKPKEKGAGGGGGGNGDSSGSDDSSSISSSGSDSSVEAEAKRAEDDKIQRRSPRKPAKAPRYKDEIEEEDRLDVAAQLSVQQQEFDEQRRADRVKIEKAQKLLAKARKLEEKLRQKLSVANKRRAYQHDDSHPDSDSEKVSESGEADNTDKRSVQPGRRDVPPSANTRRVPNAAERLAILATRDRLALREGVEPAEFKGLNTLFKLGKTDGRDSLLWTTRLPCTMFEQAQGLSMMLYEPRSNMPMLQYLMKDFKPLSDDKLRSLKSETFEILYRALVGQYSPAVQPFVNQLLSGDLARTGFLRAMSTNTDARDSALFDREVTPSSIEVELDDDYVAVDIDRSQLTRQQRFDNLTSDSKRYIARLREVTTYLMKRICANILQTIMKIGVSALTVSRQKALAVQRIVTEINRAHPEVMAGQVEYATFEGAFDHIDPEIVEVMLTFTTLCYQGVDLKRDRFQALNVQMRELLTVNWCGLPPKELMGFIDLLAEHLDAYERLDGTPKFMEIMSDLIDHIEKDAIDEGALTVSMQGVYNVLRPASGFDPSPTEVFQGLQKLAAHHRRLDMRSDEFTPTRRVNASPHYVAMLRAGGRAGVQTGSSRTRAPQRQSASSHSQQSRARQPSSRSQGYQGSSRQPRSAPKAQTPSSSTAPSSGGTAARVSSKDYSQRCRYPSNCNRVGRKWEDSGRDMCQYQHDSITSKGTLAQLKAFNRTQPPYKGQQRSTEANSGPSRRRAPSDAPRQTQRNHVGAVDVPPDVDMDL